MGEWQVYQVLKDAARQWPDKPAVYDEHGMLTFGQLLMETNALYSQLKNLGVKEGMGIGMMARNGRNFIIGLFAITGCGAAVMPIYHQLKQAEITAVLNEVPLHAVLDDMNGAQPCLGTTTIIPMQVHSFRFCCTHIDTHIPFASHVKQPAFVRFTSGTTGKSKGVVISHQSAIERIESANKGLGLTPNDTVVWTLPMAYHFVVSVVLYVRYGAAIAIVKDFLARNIIDTCNSFNGTMLYASPMQIRLLANDSGKDNMPSLKTVISTSAGISTEVCLAFKKRFGINVKQVYGIIEIGLPMMNMEKSAEHPDAVGYALPDYNVAILDDDHHSLPCGSIGHLAIQGPGMFDAYLSPPQTRHEVLKNGYFLTADYASKTADGLVKIEGRSKSVINVSGIKIFPEEIEAVLETIPEIKMARISGIPHSLTGMIIEGEVVLHEGKAIDIEEVLRYCKLRLSNFKSPHRLKIVASLPMTGSGKLQRH